MNSRGGGELVLHIEANSSLAIAQYVNDLHVHSHTVFIGLKHTFHL